jgi:hypothetical protein
MKVVESKNSIDVVARLHTTSPIWRPPIDDPFHNEVLTPAHATVGHRWGDTIANMEKLYNSQERERTLH